METGEMNIGDKVEVVSKIYKGARGFIKKITSPAGPQARKVFHVSLGPRLVSLYYEEEIKKI